jgi:hypothetical protein
MLPESGEAGGFSRPSRIASALYFLIKFAEN